MKYIIIYAPYPASTAALILPMFDLSDVERPLGSVQVLKAFDGTVRSHKKPQPTGRSYSWTFQLTRMKALELKAFYQLHVGDKWKVEEQESGDMWIGYVNLNPLVLQMDKISKISDSREKVVVNLEFETV